MHQGVEVRKVLQLARLKELTLATERDVSTSARQVVLSNLTVKPFTNVDTHSDKCASWGSLKHLEATDTIRDVGICDSCTLGLMWESELRVEELLLVARILLSLEERTSAVAGLDSRGVEVVEVKATHETLWVFPNPDAFIEVLVLTLVTQLMFALFTNQVAVHDIRIFPGLCRDDETLGEG